MIKEIKRLKNQWKRKEKKYYSSKKWADANLSRGASHGLALALKIIENNQPTTCCCIDKNDQCLCCEMRGK